MAAHAPDVRRPWTMTAWSTRAALAGSALASFAIPGWDAFLRLSMALVMLGGLAGAFAIPLVPNRNARLMRIVEVAWSGIFLLHFAGHAFDLYAERAYYDKLLHAAGGIVAAGGAYAVARATGWFWDSERPNRFVVFWTLLSAAVVTGVFAELLEYASDTLFGAGTQTHPTLSRHDDTMTDLLAETVTGAATAAALALRGGSRRSTSAARTSRSRAARR